MSTLTLRRTLAFVAVTGALLWTTQAARAAGDPARGQVLYQSTCAACHSPDFNGVGPAHRGVFGRVSGQAKGYSYSDALRSKATTWDEVTLDRWLADPEAFAPGQKMGISVPDSSARADLIAYLKTLTAK